MNLGQFVTAARSQAGIDASADTVKDWFHGRYVNMVGRAKWRAAEVDLGVTVVDQVRYAISDDVVDLEELLVGSAPYERVSTRTLYRIKNGSSRYRGGTEYSGAYAPAFSSGAVESIEVWPVPDEAGVQLTGLAAVLPPRLANDEAVPDVPEDLHGYLRDGVIAEGLGLIDERLDSAQYFEARFEEGVRLLALRKNSRVGSGPVGPLVVGHHL